jgi:hypothetical protein
MSDRTNVVLYDPITAALFLDGGFIIFLAVMLAAAAGVGVYWLIDNYTDRYARIPGTRGLMQASFLRRHIGKISIAAGFGSLFLMHLANIKGWI